MLGGACLLVAAAGCARPDPLAGFDAPRAVHLAPDGRLLVTDQGTGADDGKVVAVDLAARRRTVLLDRLPSTRGSGQQHADLAGPSGAAMAADGTVCAVIGDATREGAGFSTLRCSDGLVADLEAYERAANPDGRELASNPYDVAWDGRDGWYVSDAAANTVLHVDRAGRIRTVAVVASMAPFGGRPVQGVPTGLARAADGTAVRRPVRRCAGHRRPGRRGRPAAKPGRRRPGPAGGGRPWRGPDRRGHNPAGVGRARLRRRAGRPGPRAGSCWSPARPTWAGSSPPGWTGRSAWPASPTAATSSPRPTGAAFACSPPGRPDILRPSTGVRGPTDGGGPR